MVSFWAGVSGAITRQVDESRRPSGSHTELLDALDAMKLNLSIQLAWFPFCPGGFYLRFPLGSSRTLSGFHVHSVLMFEWSFWRESKTFFIG